MEVTPALKQFALERTNVPKPYLRLQAGKWRGVIGNKGDPTYFSGTFNSKAAAEAALKKAYTERVKAFNIAREGFLAPQEILQLLEKKGIKVGASSLKNTLEKAGFEVKPGQIGGFSLFKTPTEEQINKLKENLYKDPKSDLYKSEVPKRNKLVEKYIRQGISRTDIINKLRQESPIGVTGTTIDEIVKQKNLKIISGREADGSKVVQNIKTQLTGLDKELKDVIRAGDYTFNGLINRARKILKLPNTVNGSANAAYRVGQLIEAYRGDTQYINKTNPFLARQSVKFTQGLPKTEGFGGLKAALRRKTLETSVTGQLGEPKTFFQNVRKSLQRFLPGGINVDEVKNIASSGRYGSGPYSIFIQGIKEGVNETKGKTVDRLVGDAEFKLQNLDPIEKAYVDPKTGKVETRSDIINNYNNKAKIYEQQFNKNLKPGELPVRVPFLSEAKPGTAIKNKEAYKDFKDLFDDIHTKYGYSFEVPEDLKTIYNARNYLRSGEGQIRLQRFIKSGAGRVFAVPLAMYGTYLGAKQVGPLLTGTAAEAGEMVPQTQQIKFDEYNTATYPSNPLVREELDKIPEEPEEIAPGFTTVAAAAGVAGAKEIKKAYSAARELGRGRLRSAVGLTGGLGAFAGTLGTPLFTAAMDVPYAIDRLRQGESPSEILQDPTMYLGAAFMEPLSKASGVIQSAEKLSTAQKARRFFDLSTVAKEARPGALSKVLRLGMSPRAIAGVSRFFGLPGLLISGGLTAYDLYNTYQESKKSQGIDE